MSDNSLSRCASAGKAAALASTDAYEPVDLSPIRVHEKAPLGTYPGYRSRWTDLVVDKTLLCRAFMEIEHPVVRLCAPPGMGKSFNLDKLKNFFNALSRHDMPQANTRTYERKRVIPSELISEEARGERMKLFQDSLLLKTMPRFFEANFCRYPVISLNFNVSDVDCFPSLVRRMSWIVWYVAGQFIAGVDKSKLTETQQQRLETLITDHNSTEKELEPDSNGWETRTTAAESMFAHLDDVVHTLFGTDYIVLIDDYDGPFRVFQGTPWEDQARTAYMGLLSRILVGNKHLRKALLVGTYKVSLDHLDYTRLGSIPTLALATNGLQSYSMDSQQSGLGGLLAFGSLFGFTKAEIAEVCCEYARSEEFVDCSLDRIFDVVVELCGGYNFGVWEDIRLLATFGTRDIVSQDSERQQLIDSLYCGDTSVLEQSFEHVLTDLLDADDCDSDFTIPEFVCRYVIAKLAAPRRTTGDRTNIELDHSVLSQMHSGESSMVINIVPYGRHIQRLTLVLKFGLVVTTNSDTDEDNLAQQACTELSKISKQGCVQEVAASDLRLDIGVGIGRDGVMLCHQFWRDGKLTDDRDQQSDMDLSN
ncbi:hypothetical protein IWW55_001622 [Coemansia sp. RSA 2706]|nr:hypothetical protein IWW55_001622 [Coemansia sp. RSA 2706]